MLIRGSAIFFKFTSIALISRNLPIDSLDLYFIFIAIAAVISPLFGLQTFHVVLREFNRDSSKRGLHSQYIIYIFMIVFLLGVMLLFNVFFDDYIEGFFWLVYFLILSESFSTELTRNLIIQGRNILSNIVVLLNSFTYILFGLSIEFNIMDATLESWTSFIVVNLIICSILFIYTQKKLIDKVIFRKSLDVRSLVIASSPYLFIQILNVSIIYFSRFVLEYSGTDGSVSSYSILFSLANVIGVFITVSFIAPFSPKYMKHKGEDHTLLKKLYLIVVLFGFFSIIFLQLAFGFIVEVTGLTPLLEMRFEYFLISLSILIMSLSQVYQLKFLKVNLDKVNFYSYLSAFTMTLFMSIIFIPQYGVLGAAISLFSSSLILFCIRTYYYFKVS